MVKRSSLGVQKNGQKKGGPPSVANRLPSPQKNHKEKEPVVTTKISYCACKGCFNFVQPGKTYCSELNSPRYGYCYLKGSYQLPPEGKDCQTDKAFEETRKVKHYVYPTLTVAGHWRRSRKGNEYYVPSFSRRSGAPPFWIPHEVTRYGDFQPGESARSRSDLEAYVMTKAKLSPSEVKGLTDAALVNRVNKLSGKVDMMPPPEGSSAELTLHQPDVERRPYWGDAV